MKLSSAALATLREGSRDRFESERRSLPRHWSGFYSIVQCVLIKAQ